MSLPSHFEVVVGVLLLEWIGVVFRGGWAAGFAARRGGLRRRGALGVGGGVVRGVRRWRAASARGRAGVSRGLDRGGVGRGARDVEVELVVVLVVDREVDEGRVGLLVERHVRRHVRKSRDELRLRKVLACVESDMFNVAETKGSMPQTTVIKTWRSRPEGRSRPRSSRDDVDSTERASLQGWSSRPNQGSETTDWLRSTLVRAVDLDRDVRGHLGDAEGNEDLDEEEPVEEADEDDDAFDGEAEGPSDRGPPALFRPSFAALRSLERDRCSVAR